MAQRRAGGGEGNGRGAGVLLELRVENLAIFEQAAVSFGQGLNVLTGETGAGKSLLVDALVLALGGRADGAAVRAGAEVARVEAAFAVSSGSPALAAAREAGLAGEGDDVLVLTREVQRGGRTLARVNGRPVALGTLRSLGRHLADVSGQHEFQRLFRPSDHLDLLDAVAGGEVAGLRGEVAGLARRLRGILHRRAELAGSEAQRLQRLDLLRFQVSEIDEAAPRPDEDEELHGRLQVLENTGRLREAVARALEAIGGGEAGEEGARDALARAVAALGEAAALDARLREEAGALEGSLWQVEEAVRGLRRYVNGLAFDPEERRALADRLDLLNRLKRKYGPSLRDVLAYRDRAAGELASLAGAGEELAALAEDEARTREMLAAAAERLSRARAAAARAVEEAVERELADLALEGAHFAVRVEGRDDPEGLEVAGRRLAWDETGVDAVEFLFSANPGEPLQPLARVASGGEASRLLLALGGLLASGDRTLVFDEVDAGIGGRAARSVAVRLARLARRCQVLCVTHLATVAALADRHVLVAKEERHGRTVAAAHALPAEERARELERLLAGGSGDAARAHARELLAWASSVRSA